MADHGRDVYQHPVPVRVIHEYNFFSDSAAADKLIHTHILPLLKIPEAVREFFVPELVPIPPLQGSMPYFIITYQEITRNIPNPPQFDQRILARIDYPPVFLFQKKLSCFDVHMEFNRLSFFGSERVMRFLSGQERKNIVEDGGGLTVIATEANHEAEFKLVLATLEGKPHLILQLKDDWSRVLTALRLKNGDTLQAWGYRRRLDAEFRLVLNFIRG